jgi:hypothetical protein
LERRLHRLLKLYPKTFRKDHGQEMLSVLMDDAAADQRGLALLLPAALHFYLAARLSRAVHN